MLRNTVAKLMYKAEILPKAIRRFRITTDSRKTKASPDLIHRDVTSAHPNDLWLSDITYIPRREGWPYLAAASDREAPGDPSTASRQIAV